MKGLIDRIELPDWLYDSWPWVVLVVAGGYVLLGILLIAAPLAIYGGWVLFQRFKPKPRVGGRHNGRIKRRSKL